MAEVKKKLPKDHPDRVKARNERKVELAKQIKRDELLKGVRKHPGFDLLMEIIEEEIADARNIDSIPDKLAEKDMVLAITVEKLLVKRLESVKMNMKG